MFSSVCSRKIAEDLTEISGEDPENRVTAQKSIFVQPKKGYLKQQEVFRAIKVPSSLKKHILEYLRKSHGIYRETIYNDLHGFIKNQELHNIDYEEFVQGINYYNQGNYKRAIESYTKAIELKPNYKESYHSRGLAYSELGDWDHALVHLKRAKALAEDQGLTAFLRLIQKLREDIGLSGGVS